ncbi:hypothetical protein [Pseudoalteromonas spongiae]|uniref:hypothetical protein n=1 Tax=Pseudoalteromonas spongiae TaxID=298657 RepID=UPI000C2D3C5E|nr:hypothetical protein [Pseudoalteromonas spongiae]
MNISGASLPTMNSSESAEVLSASLAKRQQQVDGKAAIALIEAATQTMQSLPSPSKPTASLGNNIDVYV